MAIQKLTDGVEIVTFNAKIRRRDLYFKTRNEAIDGTEFIYKRGTTKQFYELQLDVVPSTMALQLNTWTDEDALLTFTIDQGVPSVNFQARLVNESTPMQMAVYDYDTYYRGTIFVREV